MGGIGSLNPPWILYNSHTSFQRIHIIKCEKLVDFDTSFIKEEIHEFIEIWEHHQHVQIPKMEESSPM